MLLLSALALIVLGRVSLKEELGEEDQVRKVHKEAGDGEILHTAGATKSVRVSERASEPKASEINGWRSGGAPCDARCQRTNGCTAWSG